MKILLHHLVPFSFAHGGQQIQIEQTKKALEQLGVDVDYIRWWDDTQTGDVLHTFCRIPLPLLKLAKSKGMKVVVADLLTEQGSRSAGQLKSQKLVSRILRCILPRSLISSFSWDSYRVADACVALTAHEAQLLAFLFDVPRPKLHVVPNGVEDVFLEDRPVARGTWLVCTATITERKRIVELAEAAVLARTPLWVIGKAYTGADPYANHFIDLVRRHPETLRFQGAISDRIKLAEIYRSARGFVLLSAMESLSLSALEAAACGCPLLLSDLPWARTVFKESVSYCPLTAETTKTAQILRHFYEAAPSLKPPAKPLAWIDVAKELKIIYEDLFKTSR